MNPDLLAAQRDAVAAIDQPADLRVIGYARWSLHRSAFSLRALQACSRGERCPLAEG